MKPKGYWEVELEPPAGARLWLRAVVAAADQAIQNCADLLATGNADKAEKTENMLDMFNKEGLVKSSDHSVMAEQYETKASDIDGVRKDLEKQHDEVNLTANTTYNTSSAAFGAIKQDVNDLKTELERVYPLNEDGLISSTTEFGLSGLVLDTVDNVYGEMETALDQVDEQARQIDTSTPSPGPGAGYTSPGGYSPASYASSGGGDSQYAGTATDEDYARYTGNSTVDAAIEGALDALGIQDPEAREKWKNGYLVLIERESSNDPNSINNWDDNAAKGQSSRGLTHTIPATFEAYHVAGTSSNIYDPVANVAASMNYVMDVYGVTADGSNLQQEVQQADPKRDPKGY
ncbi:transglycosylase SLT domain-containing protein [Nocardia sp. NBC_00416]|uniref:transglycosylase SLT domain-containing protein n=1 Tax=Nocardia sp. NBC_00416 TaxID=2975991 RepID=UPI002E1BFF85